ncbi:MAG: hypothetical protein IJQ08_00210 [Synergistaceae bacterium]|nr:hypothetical protein [Synergistaceae bacterium]
MQNQESNNYNLLQIQENKNNSYSFIENAITMLQSLQTTNSLTTHNDPQDNIISSLIENLQQILLAQQKISHIIRNFEDATKNPTHSSKHDEKTKSSLQNLVAQFLSSNNDLNEMQAQDCINALQQIVHNKQCQLAQCKSDFEIYNLHTIATTTTRASSYSFGTSKVEGLAFDPAKNPAIYRTLLPVKINVSNRKSTRKKIETLFSIDFSDLKKEGVAIAFEYRITPYDREIHNAVATLAVAGNEFINPSMIFQLLSGNTQSRNDMSPETRKNILRSIDKMMATIITIDASAEVNAHMITKTTGIYKGYLIPAERIEVIELNGQKVTDCIHLLRTPPLYEYARDKNQIGSIEISMLDTPLSNTSENIELKGYLLRRIASLRNSKNNMSDTIRYDSLFEYLRIDAPTKEALKKKRQEVRKKVKQFLDFWIEKGLISSYEEQNEGKSIAKIVISL